MNNDDGNNDYGSTIKSTLVKKTMSYWKTGICLYAEEKLTGKNDTETNVDYFQETHTTAIFH